MNFKIILENILSNYYHSTDIPLTVIDELGNEVLLMGDSVSFCKFLKIHTNSKCPCMQNHLYSGRQAEKIGEAYIFSCPAGLTNFTVPLIENSHFSGAVIAGPFLMDFPDIIMVDDIIQKFELNIDMRGRINSLLKAIEIIEPKKVTPLSKLLFIVVTSIMGKDSNELKEKNKKYVQQVQISESIQDFKNTSAKPFYLYESEKELLIKVKNRDIIGAKSILNDLLGHAFFSYGGDIDIIKSRVLELCILLSRAAVEGGADYNKAIYLNRKSISELNKIENIENLSYWLIIILDTFTDTVFYSEDPNSHSTIQKAIVYINENYKENINLDIVAKFVHLNSSYFSTIFKKEMGLSFSNYLNKIRIERSKILLKNTDYSIRNIAFEVGFEDHSYFTKLFKNLTKMTPKEYKKNEI